MSKNKAVAVAEDNLPVNFEDFSGPSGMENVTSRDLIIPRITMLQALSPQVQKKKAEFIPGAEPGMFCDVATGEIWPAIELVFCHYSRVFLEWAPRSSGKGLVANHGMDASVLEKCEKDEKGRPITKEGNLISETAQWMCINLTANGRRSFLPLASTSLKASRQLMMKIQAERLVGKDGREFTPPIYFRSWIAEATEQSNNDGDWFGYRFSPGKVITEIDPSKELLKAAKKFCDEAAKGIVQGAAESAEDHASEGAM